MQRYLLLIMALLPVLMACSKAQGGGEIPSVEMKATPSSLEFDNDVGTKSFVVTCSSNPSRIISNADWCTVKTGVFSNNSINVDVSVKENKGTDPRKAVVSVIGNLQSVLVNVTQDIRKVALEVSETSFSSECYGRWDAYFTVKSTTAPQISSNVKWCTFEAANQNSDKMTEVKVYIGANRTKESRNGEITVSCADESKTITINQKPFSVQTVSAAALTPKEVFDAFQMGWNLGNQMDAYINGVASETAWGNAKCTQQTMNKVKSAGFSSVRIPVTWMGHIGKEETYTIEEKWLDRVEEIVNYAHNAGLTAIVNIHHDSWLDIKTASTGTSRNESIKDEIACVWSQIALRFKDYGEWLVFEPFNEIQDGGWGWSAEFKADPQAQYRVLNDWNQVFVDAVRSTGGENSTRWLATVGYAQSSGSLSIDGLEIPDDYTTANRLIVGFHDYDPYLYTLNNPMVEQWGHTAEKDKRCSDTDEQNLMVTFDLFKTTYADNEIPMYIGEMGCSFHPDKDFKFQKYYIEYFCKAAADRGIPMFLWDNGAQGTGAECHAYLDHGTGEYQSENAKTLINLMVKAVTDKDPQYTLESVRDSAPEP